MGKKSRIKAEKRQQKQQNIPKAVPEIKVPAEELPLNKPNNKYATLAVYLVSAFCFLLFKCYSTSPVSGDENIYFYVGRRVFEGLTPYREIFLAHPPGHLLIASIFMAPGIYSPFWLKLVSVLPALLTLLISMRILQSRISTTMLFLCGLLLALSHNFLSVSTHFTGANWSMFFMVLAIFVLLYNRKVLAGLLFTFSALVSFHIIPAIMGILLAYFIFYRKESFATVFTAIISTVLIHLLCLIFFGDPYAEQVFGYHMQKSAMTGGGAAAITRFFHNEYHLATFAFLSFLLFVRKNYFALKRDGFKLKPDLLELILFAAIFAQIAGLFYVSRVFTYYLITLVPLFVVASGNFFERAYWYLLNLKKSTATSKSKALIIASTIIIIAVCFVFGEHLESRMGYYKRQYGEVSTYEWKDSACLPGFVNQAVKALFFSEKRRVGDLDNSLKRYFWHESVTESPIGMLEHLHEYDNIQGTIFGDASTAPYFALETHRRIALEQADTNVQLFKSGVLDMKILLAKLNADPPALVAIDPRRGIATHPWFKNWLKNSFKMVSRVNSAKNKKLELYLRRDL